MFCLKRFDLTFDIYLSY